MDSSWAKGRRSHEQHPLTTAGRRSSGSLLPASGPDADDAGSSSYEVVMREDSERRRLELSLARYRSAEVHSVVSTAAALAPCCWRLQQRVAGLCVSVCCCCMFAARL